ncbi:vWA domain-containing protein [Massiliimalia massiliensis]|uniref:vWA domain-containing protein n=1 Tax=Massiliimalia massiliensis TaxID=1852384 RepID=UPI0009F8AB5C|nr:VWA domain-containing protein [Massiliimalia massiliensis]
MKKHFNTVEQAKKWLTNQKQELPSSSTLLHATNLCKMIYDEFSDTGKIYIREKICPNYQSLEEDIFCALYSPIINRKDQKNVSNLERYLNRPILEILLQDDRMEQLKRYCENKELPSFETAQEFCQVLQDQLELNSPEIPELNFLSVIDLLTEQIYSLLCRIAQKESGATHTNVKQVLFLYDKVRNKISQIKNLHKKVNEGVIRYIDRISPKIGIAIDAALEKSIETHTIISAWGNETGSMMNISVNQQLIKHVRNSEKLQEIAKTLGKYRKIIADKRKNSYAYGLGEKYDVVFGNDLSNCLSSELALLGTKETELLFLRKYDQKRLAQYRRRMGTIKGKGDMIVLIDESSSIREVINWSKAFALALLDIAAKEKRRYAMIHFSSADQIKTDLFEPGHYHSEDVLNAAEQFWGGGTDFEAPLQEALKLMEQGYENADLTIITDGECEISNAFAEHFRNMLAQYRAVMTGILLDKGQDSCGKSLIPFCSKIYHSKDLIEDEIAIQILNSKVS